MNHDVRVAIGQYLEWKSSYTTRAFINYRPWLLRFATSIGNKSLEDLELGDVVKFRLWLDNKYQPYTIQLAMVAIHNFFKWCSIMKYQTVSSALVRVPKTEARGRPVVYEEDFNKLISHLSKQKDFLSFRNNLIIHILWDTGMRISELCDLNVDSMELDKRQATVLTRKSKKFRKVFWSFETQALLRIYLEKRKVLAASPALFIGMGRTGSTTRIRPRTLQRILVILSQESGLKKIVTPHSFRHGKAHRILDMGGNPKHIQTILGHSENNPMASYQYIKLNNIEHEETCRRFLESPTNTVNVAKYT